MSSWPPLSEMLPQAGPMRLLERVEAHDGEHTVCVALAAASTLFQDAAGFVRSWVALERGDWERAADTVELVLMENCTLSCLQARVVLVLLRARRGDPDPWTPLA